MWYVKNLAFRGSALFLAFPPIQADLPPSTFYQHHGRVYQGLESIRSYCRFVASSNGKFGMEVADRVGVYIGDMFAVSNGEGRGHIYPNLPNRVREIEKNTWNVKTNDPRVPEVQVTFTSPIDKSTHTRIFVIGNCVSDKN